MFIIDWLIVGVYRHFQQYFSYIMATSFSGGRSRSTRRKPPTLGSQLVDCITCGCEWSALFFYNLQNRARIQAVLVIGLYELLGNPSNLHIEPPGPFFIIENLIVTVKLRIAKKAQFLYFKLCLCVRLDSLSCSFTLTFTYLLFNWLQHDFVLLIPLFLRPMCYVLYLLLNLVRWCSSILSLLPHELTKVCQWLATGRWFSLGTPVFSTNKTDHHDIIWLQ